MKVFVFAHVPPPHHGQSQVVKLLLHSFHGTLSPVANADRIECHRLENLNLLK